MANPKHAAQMTDEQIIAAIDADPRMAYITAAARRDPATIERDPDVDPRHIDQVLKSRAEREKFLATLPPERPMMASIFNTLATAFEDKPGA